MASAIAIISAATHYAFNADNSISIKGKLGFLQVNSDGTVNQSENGMNSAYHSGQNIQMKTGVDYLEIAKREAVKLLSSK